MSKVCLNHPDREATDRCVACFKPLCDECVISYEGQPYCSESCRDGALKTTANIADFQQAEQRSKRKRAVRKFIILLIIAAVIAGAVYYLMHDKKYGSQLQQQIQQQIDKQIENIPGAETTE